MPNAPGPSQSKSQSVQHQGRFQHRNNEYLTSFLAIDTLDTEYWTYRMEWTVGPSGGLAWLYNGEFVWGMSASSFGAYEVSRHLTP